MLAQVTLGPSDCSWGITVSAHAGAEEGDTQGRGHQSPRSLDPTIRDCVVQGALKLILEPTFEADFQSGSYGYRPKRSAREAVDRVAQAIAQGLTQLIDLDLRAQGLGKSKVTACAPDD